MQKKCVQGDSKIVSRGSLATTQSDRSEIELIRQPPLVVHRWSSRKVFPSPSFWCLRLSLSGKKCFSVSVSYTSTSLSSSLLDLSCLSVLRRCLKIFQSTWKFVNIRGRENRFTITMLLLSKTLVGSCAVSLERENPTFKVNWQKFYFHNQLNHKFSVLFD